LNENILIVDDDVKVRKTLSSILLEEGYSVDAVENGKQAIRACENAYFDVALIDVELPDMKGTELLLGLKKRRPEMIKIIVTGFPSIENAMKAVNEGADGYVLKPFDVPKLLEMIRKHLDEKAAEHLRIWMEKSEMEQKAAEFSEQFKRRKGSIFSH
jgi:DNA-binding NtrC family response regulator